MKRFGNLYEKIISLENLRMADQKARKGKLLSIGVIKHDQARGENIIRLHDTLKNKDYKTSDYTVFKMITDNGKEREIFRLPYFPDRILHHAVMNIMEPIWLSTLTTDTYSCIKGRGIHGVVRKLKQEIQLQDKTKYCLKIDIRKFYPSVDHDILKVIIRRKIKDDDLLSLLDEIIDSAAGLPIGNYLSQFFANLYLSGFDHWIKEEKKVKYYYRYADDMVFLHSDKEFLHGLLVEINHFFNNNLNLQLKSNFQVFPVSARGIDFVGYKFFHTHTLIRKSIKVRFCRRVARINKQPAITRQAFNQKICSWNGWMKHCNAIHLMKTIIPQNEAI
ncbi:MAG: reverse transcriptase domain-containing protein [Verrucomicrobiota bacterium]